MVLGVGTDIIEIDRIKKVFKNRNDRITQKIFTPVEIEYSFSFKDPYTHLAVRFAAKEAYYKALGEGVLFFNEIEVVNNGSGKPSLKLYGRTEELWKSRGSPTIHLSLSHINLLGCATVVLDR